MNTSELILHEMEFIIIIIRPGNHFTNAVKSSLIRFYRCIYCILKLIVILNSNFEYTKTDNKITKTDKSGTLSLVCRGNSVHSNMAMDICVLKNSYN